jgi:hypothetical protein
VSEGPNEVEAAGLPRTFPLDDGAGGIDTIPPITSITAPLNGATVSGMSTVNATAGDDVAVARVEFWLDGALQSTDFDLALLLDLGHDSVAEWIAHVRDEGFRRGW